MWITAGALMLAGIWQRVIARWALSLGAALWAVWSASYLLSWLVEDQSRAWVTGTAFALIAALMWIIAALADARGPPCPPTRTE